MTFRLALCFPSLSENEFTAIGWRNGVVFPCPVGTMPNGWMPCGLDGGTERAGQQSSRIFDLHLFRISITGLSGIQLGNCTAGRGARIATVRYNQDVS